MFDGGQCSASDDLEHLLADLGTDPRFDGPCPVVVMGDLNAADSSVLRSLRDVLTDAWVAGGGVDAITLPSTRPSAPLEAGPQVVDQRIGHIFFRPGREDQHVIIEGVRIAVRRCLPVGSSCGRCRPALARLRRRWRPVAISMWRSSAATCGD